MIETFAVTLRRQWTDKLQVRCVTAKLPAGVHVTITREEVHLEGSELGDLYEAVNKIKDSVVDQLVSSSSSFQTESVGSSGTAVKTAHDNVEMDQEMDEEHKVKDASVEGQKTSNVKDNEKRGTAEDDNSRKTVNDRKGAHQKEKKQKANGFQKPESHPVPARDVERSHKQRSSTEDFEPDGDDSHDETASVKSRPAPVAESAPTCVGDDEQSMQAGDTEPCKGFRDADVTEQFRQSQYNASENNISSSDDILAATSQRQKEKYLMDESLWAYIQFIDPQSKWDEKLSVFSDTKLGREKVELTGLSTDIDKLKKFCDTNRLQRAVTRKIQRVPSRCGAEVFRNQLIELSQSKILVRLVIGDPHNCELLGKNSDIVKLEKAIFSKYPKPVENTKIPDIQQSTMLTGPLSASSVTSSSREVNTVLPYPATAASAAAENDFSRSSYQMRTRMTEQMLEAELDFQTALAQLKVRVVTGDLLKWPCEVLVDSCDTELRHSGGLAWSFAKAAGHKMQAECNAYKRERGLLPQCGVMDTDAGDIQPPVRRLIHACGPNSHSYRSLDECGSMLELTFQKCLLHANDMLYARSIALPAISSGKVGGVPCNIVAAAACRALILFDRNMASTSGRRHLTDIYFVNIEQDVTRCMIDVFKSILLLPMPGAVVEDATFSRNSISSSGNNSDCHQDMRLDYAKLKSVAAEKGLVIVDVPVDGDCALHAVIRQLQQLQGIRQPYDVSTLRQLATKYLESHTELLNLTVLRSCYGCNIKAYLKQQSISGTLCDESMLHAVACVTKTVVCLLDDSGHTTKFEPRETYPGNVITIGRIAGAHYVSLEARDAPSNRDRYKLDEFLSTSGASVAPNDRFKPAARDDRGPGDNQEAVLRYSYSKLKSEADKRKLSVADVPQTEDSALHAVVRQLSLQDDFRLFDVATLRKRAVDYLYQHTHLIDKDFSKAQSYLSAQSATGAHCDEIMLSAVSDVIEKEIRVLRDDGSEKKFGMQTSYARPVTIGVYAKVHFVSLEPSVSKHKYNTPSDMDKSSQLQNDVAVQSASTWAADAGHDDKPLAAVHDTCPICIDVIKDPKRLTCNHVFCSQCIDQSLSYQPKCPCCGKIFGVLKGDQPEGGSMHVRKDKWFDLEGYPRCGRIVIDYYIPDGRQKENHPNPGERYTGARRTAYLPGNAEGEEICRLLEIAFDAGLIFTVSRSTTSGRDNVVTWNDIHHKTKPSGPFGYPDTTYLARVRDELAAKGITSDKLELTAASSASPRSRLPSSSVSSFPMSTGLHVSVVTVGTSASTPSSVSTTAAGSGGGQALTTPTSRMYPFLTEVSTSGSSTTSPVGNSSSLAWRRRHLLLGHKQQSRPSLAHQHHRD